MTTIVTFTRAATHIQSALWLVLSPVRPSVRHTGGSVENGWS